MSSAGKNSRKGKNSYFQNFKQFLLFLLLLHVKEKHFQVICFDEFLKSAKNVLNASVKKVSKLKI